VIVKQVSPANFKPFPLCWFETIPATFGGYLPQALATRAYKVAPPPLVISQNGLDGIQDGIDLMRAVAEKGQEGVKEALSRAVTGKEKGMPSVIKLVVERA